MKPAGYNLVAWTMIALLLCAAATGCLHRRMTIRTNPPGAQVYIDGYEIGTTPCSTSFLYYGTRNIRLERDGYETLHVKQYIPAPWYEIPPLDFFAENLTPGEIRDERTLNFTMQPQLIVPTDQLLSRAEDLRRNTQAGTNAQNLPVMPGVVPLPNANPGGFAPLPNPTGTQSIPSQGQVIEEVVPLPAPSGSYTLPPEGLRSPQ
jgi:hypothetical protein